MKLEVWLCSASRLVTLAGAGFFSPPPSCLLSVSSRHLEACLLHSLQLHPGPVVLGQLVGDVCEHFLDTLPRLAGGLVDAGHQVVALLTEGLHVTVCYLDLVLLVELISTSKKTFLLSISKE